MPVTVKVDSARNIWTACEVYGSTSDSAVQEYTSGQALAATYYTTGCPANYSTCSSFTTGSFDESASAADVFSAVNFTLNDAASGCTPCTGGGFLYWPAASPSTTPTLILLPYDNPVEIVYYVDLDSAGNIWFDYYGGCSNVCGYGLGEITNPTTIPSFVSQLAPGSIAYPGGVYISANGKISYTDQMARTITRCTLPGLTGCTPLGPTVLHLGHGSPVSGGYNHAETLNIQGDSFGWLDRGQVNPNIWHYVHNNDMTAGAYGADYTPSDR
jgi:hypothetical protein